MSNVDLCEVANKLMDVVESIEGPSDQYDALCNMVPPLAWTMPGHKYWHDEGTTCREFFRKTNQAIQNGLTTVIPEPEFPYVCPKCGERESLLVYPVISVELNAITGEIDKDTGDTHWVDGDQMVCQICQFDGTVKEFTPVEEVKQAHAG
jgi:hypothetical protein